MKKIAIVFVVFWISCGTAYGQAPFESQTTQIQKSEAAVRSSQGRSDGIAWLRLAILYQDAARYDDAERAFRRAKDLLKTGDRARYADALDRMGAMYVERGKFVKANSLEQKALKIRQEQNDAVGMGRSFMHLSLLAYGKHDPRLAETDAEMAVSLLDPERPSGGATEGATQEEKMSALIDLALIRCALDDCGAARHDLEKALRLAEANYETNSLPVGFVTFLVGYSYTKTGDVRSGLALMSTGIEEMKSQMGWGHPTYVAALREYRTVLVREGRKDEADEVEERIEKLRGASGSVRNTAGLLGINALR